MSSPREDDTAVDSAGDTDRHAITTRSCDGCRRRKVRCIPQTASHCARCTKLKLDCTYHIQPLPRGRKRKSAAISEDQNDLSVPDDAVTTQPQSPSRPQSSSRPQSPSRRPTIRKEDDLPPPAVPPAKSTMSPLQSPVNTFLRGMHQRPSSSINLVSSVSTPLSSYVSTPDVTSGLTRPKSSSSLRSTAHASLAGRTGQTHPTDALAPRQVIINMLHDYLEMLYALIPVVHRPTFLKDISSNRDHADPDFFCFIIGICAVLVGTTPSTFDKYRNQNPRLEYATRKEMLNQCYSLLLEIRGPTYFDEVNHQKWATSYMMALAFFQIGEHNRARMIEVESMQFGRLLHFHRIGDYAGLNHIEQQLRKKAFWLLFFGYVHSQLQSLRKERLTFLDPVLLHSIDLNGLLPLDVDDEDITEDHVTTRTDQSPCLTTGFNVHSRLFALAIAASRGNTVHRVLVSSLHADGSRQHVEHLTQSLSSLRYALNNIPGPLQQWASPCPDPSLAHHFGAMRVNIHVTHLWLQSVLLDQLESILFTDTRMAEHARHLSTAEARWAERESISSQLLHVLHSISKAEVEPNGLHLAYKVRDVAVGLLSCPFQAHEPASIRAAEYVSGFTDLLSVLDSSETVNTANLQTWVDTDRERGKCNIDEGVSTGSWLCWA